MNYRTVVLALVTAFVELEEAATTSGAGLFTVMRRILVPLIMPSLVAGGLYLFILSVKVMSMAAILWTPDSVILAIYVLQLWGEGSLTLIGAFSVVIIGALTVMTIVARTFAQRRTFVTEI